MKPKATSPFLNLNEIKIKLTEKQPRLEVWLKRTSIYDSTDNIKSEYQLKIKLVYD